MLIVVFAADNEWQQLKAAVTGEIEWVKAKDGTSTDNYPGAAAFFIMDTNIAVNFNNTTKPVFINSVTITLQELNAAANVIRINGWQGFLQRPVWEIAGRIDTNATIIVEKLNKKAAVVKDEPGLVSARIIAMIINEAYFALGDDVSTKEEIDIAMKLGTNYPFGPFEWAEKIGLKNIYDLLQKLSATGKRYLPAPMLIKEITEKN
jgi:3-hydroxybutyryl-CoA dehydrogenase